MVRTSHCLYSTVVVISVVLLFPKQNSFNRFKAHVFMFEVLCHIVITFCLCGYIIILHASYLQTILLFAEDKMLYTE